MYRPNVKGFNLTAKEKLVRKNRKAAARDSCGSPRQTAALPDSFSNFLFCSSACFLTSMQSHVEISKVMWSDFLLQTARRAGSGRGTEIVLDNSCRHAPDSYKFRRVALLLLLINYEMFYDERWLRWLVMIKCDISIISLA